MIEIKFIYTCVRHNGHTFSSSPFTLEDIEDGHVTAWYQLNSVSGEVYKRMYTGLKDKKGVEIYGDDIIHSLYSDGSDCRHIVKWVDSDARFKIFDLKRGYDCGGISQDWIHENEKEVIGNTRQNPELL